jgi:hypothetical protein
VEEPVLPLDEDVEALVVPSLDSTPEVRVRPVDDISGVAVVSLGASPLEVDVVPSTELEPVSVAPPVGAPVLPEVVTSGAVVVSVEDSGPSTDEQAVSRSREATTAVERFM